MGTAGDQAGFIAFAQSRRAPWCAAWLMCHDRGLAEDATMTVELISRLEIPDFSVVPVP